MKNSRVSWKKMTIASASLFLLPLLPVWQAVIHPDRKLRYTGQAVILLLIAVAFAILLLFIKQIENRVRNAGKVKTSRTAENNDTKLNDLR